MSDVNVETNVQDVENFIDIFKNLNWQTWLEAILLFVFGVVVVRLLLKLIRKTLKRTAVPESLHTMLVTIIRIVLYALVLLTVASKIGIPVTSFVTLIGIAGLAISMAVQGILQNLAGGMILLGSRPFKVGDVAEVDGLTGTILDIHMMNTLMESFDGKRIYLPNSKLYTSTIINYTQKGKRRVELKLSASYNQTPAQVREAVMSAVQATPGVLDDPAPRMLTENYGESDIAYTLWVWCNSPDFVNVKYGISEALFETFRECGVEMTYPHLNVHMDPPETGEQAG